jgi:hypothetical protein
MGNEKLLRAESGRPQPLSCIFPNKKLQLSTSLAPAASGAHALHSLVMNEKNTTDTELITAVPAGALIF